MRVLRWLLLLVLVAGGACAWLLARPYGPHSETFVDIPAGTGTVGMAHRLRDAGVIRSATAFELLRRVRGGRLQAGEYRFDHPVTLTELYSRIARGDVYTIAVTVPEGFNLFDIAAAVQAAKLAPAPSFIVVTQHDTALIHDLSPQAPSLEGFLFPDTYRFSRHTTPEMMAAAMVKRFRQQAAVLGLPSGPDLVRTVTLASLIEKEVAVPGERPLVAGVFENRLRAGMPLATDPSIIYAALLNGRWRGTIYRSDLQFDSPYNTYLHAGLPPGPIANPGAAALRAAMHPQPTDYLYFVADAAGHTRFARDLQEHTANVEAYRIAEAHGSEPAPQPVPQPAAPPAAPAVVSPRPPARAPHPIRKPKTRHRI